jgi:PAS domain S-box-containing protein
MRRGILVFAFAAAAVAFARASSAAPLQFERITAENGLPADWVQGIFKDSRGFVWFGTQEGLARDDAGTLTIYRHDPANASSLPFTSAKVLLEDSHKQLWIGSSGLARFDPQLDRFHAYPTDGPPKGPTGIEMRAMVEDPSGHLWLGTNRGLNEYVPESETFALHGRDFLKPDAPGNQVNALVLGRLGQLWVATAGGLARLNVGTGRFEAWTDRADEPLLTAEILGLYGSGDGTIWAATMGHGLHALDPETGHVTRYVHDPRRPDTVSTDRLRCLAGDGKGLLFIGTENGGLDILDTKTGSVRHNTTDVDDPRSLGSASIYSLYYDDQGILWIGTFNGGVNILSPPGQRFETIRAGHGGLNDPHVMAILEDRAGNLWVGTDGGGLNRRDGRTGHWTTYRNDPQDPSSLASNAVLALAQDADGTIWVGGWDAGLASYDPRTDKFVRYRHRKDDPGSIPGDHVFTIVPLSTGELLVGTFTGPFLFDRKTKTSTLLPARRLDDGTYDTFTCFSALEDRDGNLWVGAEGLDFIDRKSGKVTRYRNDLKDPKGLGGGTVFAMLADSRGNVWVSIGDALHVFEAGTHVRRRFTTEDGLPHKNVDGILEDGSQNLWLSTGHGIVRFNQAVQLPAKPTFVYFDTRDGLQSSEFRYGATFKNAHGQMFFGGPHGLNAFFPDTIQPNPVPPPVVFTGLKLFNRPVPIGAAGSPLRRALFDTDALTLSYKQSMVTIEYAALNYLMPEKNQYAYRLEGADADREWNKVGTQRAATYPNLAPGHYKFMVRAWNNDGVPNEEGVSLSIVVTPPFWQTWWFRALVLAAVVAGLATAYRRRVNEMVERRRELETEVDRRTADLAQRTADLQKEIAERAETERKLEQQTVEAREYAERLAETNTELVDNRDALQKENADRRRAEEQAVRERDLLHALMDHIPDLIYFKDSQSRLTRINRAYAAFLGLDDPAAADGRTEAAFLPGGFAQASLRDESEIFSGGRPLIGKVEHEPRSGRWLLSSKVPIRNANNQITGLVGISKDITEHKQAEERLAGELASFREIVHGAAQGDLTKRGVESEETIGQIAQAVNRMLESFSNILLEMRDTAFAVSASSSQILATATQIARGAELGSDEVHETTASVEEMAASMAQVSASAFASAEKGRLVLEHVQASDRAVDAAYRGMTKINAAAEETAQKMKLLEQRSREVFEIIDMIDEVASQSKLLSLNAAIEAAHAGEAGRGFAVVAEEVGRLAEKSTQATKAVSGRIDAILEETQGALQAIKNAMREVKAAWALSEQARQSLANISTLVQGSADVSMQIARASQEQATATEGVASAMEAISQFTTNSARGARETSQAVTELVQLSNQLSAAMSKFKIDPHS